MLLRQGGLLTIGNRVLLPESIYLGDKIASVEYNQQKMPRVATITAMFKKGPQHQDEIMIWVDHKDSADESLAITIFASDYVEIV